MSTPAGGIAHSAAREKSRIRAAGKTAQEMARKPCVFMILGKGTGDGRISFTIQEGEVCCLKQCHITTVYSDHKNAREAREMILDSFLAFLRKELRTPDLFAEDAFHRV